MPAHKITAVPPVCKMKLPKLRSKPKHYALHENGYILLMNVHIAGGQYTIILLIPFHTVRYCVFVSEWIQFQPNSFHSYSLSFPFFITLILLWFVRSYQSYHSTFLHFHNISLFPNICDISLLTACIVSHVISFWYFPLPRNQLVLSSFEMETECDDVDCIIAARHRFN